MRYSYADKAREQQAEPTCHAPIYYIASGRPPSLPDDSLSCVPSHQRPSVSKIPKLAGKGQLHNTDDGIALLVRQLTLHPPPGSQHSVRRAACLSNDEYYLVYVPLLMRPWVMHACHSTASCHLGTIRTLRMIERFSLVIGMSIRARWCICHCLQRQPRQTSRLTVRWSVISMPLPEGPGIAVRVDSFGPIPVTR